MESSYVPVDTADAIGGRKVELMKETGVGGLRVVTDGQVTTDVRSQTTTAELLRLSRRLAPRHRHR